LKGEINECDFEIEYEMRVVVVAKKIGKIA